MLERRGTVWGLPEGRAVAEDAEDRLRIEVGGGEEEGREDDGGGGGKRSAALRRRNDEAADADERWRPEGTG